MTEVRFCERCRGKLETYFTGDLMSHTWEDCFKWMKRRVNELEATLERYRREAATKESNFVIADSEAESRFRRSLS